MWADVISLSCHSSPQSPMSTDETVISRETDTLLDRAPGPKRVEREPLLGFMMFGFVVNSCYNYVLQEVKYFNDVFGDGFGSRCNFIFGMSSNLSQILVILFGAYVSIQTRIVVSCAALGAMLIAMPVLAFTQFPFQMWIVYSVLFGMGFTVAILASAGFGLTGMCSVDIRRYFMLGNCLAGVTTWPLMLFVEQILKRFFHMSPIRVVPDRPSSLENMSTLVVLSVAALGFFITIPYYVFGLARSMCVEDALRKIKAGAALTGPDKGGIASTLMATLPMAVAVWNVMFVTFLALPDQMVSWKPSFDYPWDNSNTYQDMIIFMFNVFDVVGRFLALQCITMTPAQVMVGSFGRWLLIPFYFLATTGVAFFGNDVFKLVLQAAFATTYGLFLTWGMTHGPTQSGLREEQADTAGYIMSFALDNGVFLGSHLSGQIQDIPKKLLEYRPYMRSCQYGDSGALACYDPVQTAMAPIL